MDKVFSRFEETYNKNQTIFRNLEFISENGQFEDYWKHLSYRVEPHNMQHLKDNQKSYNNIVDTKGLERDRHNARLVDQFWVVD